VRDQIKDSPSPSFSSRRWGTSSTSRSWEELIPGVGEARLAPEPDTSKLADLKGVQSITVTGVLGPGGQEYDQGGRNIFQFGVVKPPPPTRAELEAIRKAEEARLKASRSKPGSARNFSRAASGGERRRAREAAEALKRQQDQQQAIATAAPKGLATPPPLPSTTGSWATWDRRRGASRCL